MFSIDFHRIKNSAQALFPIFYGLLSLSTFASPGFASHAGDFTVWEFSCSLVDSSSFLFFNSYVTTIKEEPESGRQGWGVAWNSSSWCVAFPCLSATGPSVVSFARTSLKDVNAGLQLTPVPKFPALEVLRDNWAGLKALITGRWGGRNYGLCSFFLFLF